MVRQNDNELVIPDLTQDPCIAARVVLWANAAEKIDVDKRDAALFFLLRHWSEGKDKDPERAIDALLYIATNRGCVSRFDLSSYLGKHVRLRDEVFDLVGFDTATTRRAVTDDVEMRLTSWFTAYCEAGRVTSARAASDFVARFHKEFFTLAGRFGPSRDPYERVMAFQLCMVNTRLPLVVEQDTQEGKVANDEVFQVMRDLVPEAKYLYLPAARHDEVQQKTQSAAFAKRILEIVREVARDALAGKNVSSPPDEPGVKVGAWHDQAKARLRWRLWHVLNGESLAQEVREEVREQLGEGLLETVAIARLTALFEEMALMARSRRE